MRTAAITEQIALRLVGLANFAEAEARRPTLTYESDLNPRVRGSLVWCINHCRLARKNAFKWKPEHDRYSLKNMMLRNKVIKHKRHDKAVIGCFSEYNALCVGDVMDETGLSVTVVRSVLKRFAKNGTLGFEDRKSPKSKHVRRYYFIVIWEFIRQLTTDSVGLVEVDNENK